MKINKIILFIPVIGLLYVVLLNQFYGLLLEDKKLEKIFYIYQFFSMICPIVIRQFFVII